MEFNAGFETKPKFARLIRGAARLRLMGQHLTLLGCAVALARNAGRQAATA